MVSTIMILSAMIGVAIGGLKARKKGGTRLDIAQYAGTYALIFMVIGLIVTVIFLRSNID